MQAEAADIAGKIAELASRRFGVPTTPNFRRLKSDDPACQLYQGKVRRADLRFDLSGDLSVFEPACREQTKLADAFGVMEALREGGGGKRLGAPDRALYLIQVADDPIVKIGVSSNPYSRLMNLQAAHYRELFLWAVVFSPDVKAMTIEQTVLGMASQDGSRLMGEWIAESPEKIFSRVLQVAAEKSIAICNAEIWLHNMMERTKRIARSQTSRGLQSLASKHKYG